jgi:type II secretory pathway component PulM
MAPILLLFYLLAVAGGLLAIGIAGLFLIVVYAWFKAPAVPQIRDAQTRDAQTRDAQTRDKPATSETVPELRERSAAPLAERTQTQELPTAVARRVRD